MVFDEQSLSIPVSTDEPFVIFSSSVQPQRGVREWLGRGPAPKQGQLTPVTYTNVEGRRKCCHFSNKIMSIFKKRIMEYDIFKNLVEPMFS